MERPEDFLGPGASFCSSGLSLVYGFRGGLSLAGSEVEVVVGRNIGGGEDQVGGRQWGERTVGFIVCGEVGGV